MVAILDWMHTYEWDSASASWRGSLRPRLASLLPIRRLKDWLSDCPGDGLTSVEFLPQGLAVHVEGMGKESCHDVHGHDYLPNA